jgi:hypothetical protein
MLSSLEKEQPIRAFCNVKLEDVLIFESDQPTQEIEQSSRVASEHYCPPAPSEPCLRLSPHTAQAFLPLYPAR